MKGSIIGGYKSFKKALVIIGGILALVLIHSIIFVLIPFIKKLHNF